ncbi:hypothetical protein ACO0SA_000486 [Hanseniaspora valbyensis]
MFKNNTLVRQVIKRNKVTLPKLNWEFNELEPYIMGKINELHYTKHHQTYVNGFNDATSKLKELEVKLQTEERPLFVAQEINSLQQNLKFHSGGYINHCLFWENLSPNMEKSSSGKGGVHSLNKDTALYQLVVKQYGSLDNLIAAFKKSLMGVQGSGWSFLVYSPVSNSLEIVQTYNQDSVPVGKGVVLLAIDAWEHAYYLQYQNRKAEYFDAVWNVVNWEVVAQRLEKLIAK